MAKTDVTTREFLEYLEGKVEDKYEDKRKALLAAIDTANSNKAAKNAEKKAEENAPIAEGIKAYLVGTMTATEIKDALNANGIKVSTPKVTAVAKLLVEDGTLKVEKKVGDTKNYYTLA